MEEIKIPWADWKIEERIGKGGFGMVYKILHRDEFNVEEYAAMKIIRFPQDDHENAVLLSEGYDKDSIVAYNRERLDKVINEYAIMMKMKGHRNIVRCDDCKAVPHEDGMGWDVYIRMELLTPLHTRLVTGGLSEADVVKLGKDLCQALIQCEKEKIVHRDIKPENIFANDFGDYKLGDFGISRSLEHTTNATRTGSLRFMAPEVYKGQKYGTTVDTYSLGLVMYWLLNNRRMPFAPLDHPATVLENLEAMRRRLGGTESIPAPANGSEALKSIILKACSYTPNERYFSAEELFNELSSLRLRDDVPVEVCANETVTDSVLGKKESIQGTDDKTVREQKENTDSKYSKNVLDTTIPVDQPEIDSNIASEWKRSITRPEQAKPGKWKVVIAVVVGVLVILSVVWLFLSKGNNDDSVHETSPVVSEEPMQEESKPGPSEEEVVSDTTGMIFPNSAESRLNNSDIEGLDVDELRHALNEIYARHGYIFRNEVYQSEFEAYSWYEPTIDADDWNGDAELNRTEKYNVEFLKVALQEKGIEFG